MSLHRTLAPFVDVRKEETVTAVLMFAYSFLAMTAYNIIQPLTRMKLIASLGAVNVPWVVFGSGLVIGILMLGYTRLVTVLPRRWALPITQAAMAAVMVGFWLLFRTGSELVSVGFYVWGGLLGILLISQFWTLANGIYDPRQARRLFGFVGGGVMLGGMTGAGITAFIIQHVGADTLLLWSAFTLVLCFAIVSMILGRERQAATGAAVEEEKGVTYRRALTLLRESRQIQLIAAVISFGSLGALVIDQQLNMAAEAFKGAGEEDSIGAFLAQVRFSLSAAAFVIQVWITPRVHRYLGIGFALLILPTNLAATAAITLLNVALWAPALASVTDRSLRYTVDKTTREVLFLPLPSALRQDIKPFVDVTVDRLSRTLGALLVLVLIQPWGLRLAWHQLSLISLGLAGLWYLIALRAKREYLAAFRRSLEQRTVQPGQVRLTAADLSTIEALVQELANPEVDRVVYAIDLLESLDKRNLVTPLLLYHESPTVRARALGVLAAARTANARRWAPNIQRLLGDPDPSVRAAAIAALGAISNEDAATLARPMLSDPDPRIRATAAGALAGSSRGEDLEAAEAALVDLIADTSDASRHARRDVAAAIRHIGLPQFRRLLIPLLYDPAPEVADEAMESVRAAGAHDFLFVPTLVALLRHRRLKSGARTVLVSYGEPVVDVLAHFMRDPEEDIWVRRHVPATLAQLPSQKSVDVLAAALDEPDGFLRYKAIAALQRLRRGSDSLHVPREPIETLLVQEGRRYCNYLTLQHNLFREDRLPSDSSLARAIEQKLERTKDRIYRLLALIYAWRDITAAQWTLEHGGPRARASASEYLDNVLPGHLRNRIMPILEPLPLDEKVRRANVLLRTRPRDVEETLLQLINDADQVIAAAAIDAARQHKIWGLVEDIEYVLAHRDPRDWYVFEAASWALAERRLPAARRRELWHEPLPASELASHLRELPLFASVSVDELFRIASASRQVRHDPGAVLVQEGAVPDSVHFLLDGHVGAWGREGVRRLIRLPAALGFSEVLAGVAAAETLRTDGAAVTLAMSAEELRMLLADNANLVSGLFATMADSADPAAALVASVPAASELEELARGGLSAVDRVLVLQHLPLFSRVSAEEMRYVADIARAVTFALGAQPFAHSDPPALWVVLAGELRLGGSSSGAVATARAGDVIGATAMMAGRPLGLAAEVVQDGVALRIDRDDLFAAFGERPELLRQTFAGIFRADAPRQAA